MSAQCSHKSKQTITGDCFFYLQMGLVKTDDLSKVLGSEKKDSR